MGSNIEDYSILSTHLEGDYKTGTYKNIGDFEDEVNGFLKKGYTLHGPTLINGTTYHDISLTQVVLKYADAKENKIRSYKLVLGVFYRQLNIPWIHDPCTSEEDSSRRSLFEVTICEDVRNGWSLYGDIQYHKQRGGGEGPRGNVPPHFIQALVKYRTVLLMPSVS
jgi:hypothetical protein